MTADEVIAALGLTAHPEGGWYRQTWVADAAPGTRPAGTAIYYLLGAGERSHWHRIDATEVWLFHAGAPLVLSMASDDRGSVEPCILSADLAVGARPQAIVPAGFWQAAETTGAWSLVSCTVAPGFIFETFELAPPGWSPGQP